MKSVCKKMAFTIGLTFVFGTTVEATPAFSRQMDTACMSCHSQNIPKLNSFGRSFKLSGFTMVGDIKEIKSKENGGLSLPGTLGFGFVIKARLHDDGKDSTVLKTEIFDESAIIFGGKIADNVGTSMEFTEGLVSGKVTFAQEAFGGYIGATYYMTDGLGAFSGTEIYNTGLYRPIRQFENRKKANIFQKLGIGSGSATGAQIYFGGNYGLYATVAQYVPVFASSVQTGSNFKTLVRVAYEKDISGFNVALGGYYIGGDVSEITTLNTGNTKLKATDKNSLDRESTGIDLQIEGNIKDMSLMITGGYVLSNKFSLDSNVSDSRDTTGFSLAAQLNPVKTIGAKIAILGYNDNKDSNNDELIYSLGTDYNYRQNVRFCLEYSFTTFSDSTKKDNSDILFMSMIAF